MALRMGFGLPARPSDGPRPRTTARPTKGQGPDMRGAASVPPASDSAPLQPRPVGRAPRSTSIRRMGLPQLSTRSTSNSQPKSHVQSGSASSPSATPRDDGICPGPVPSNRFAASRPENRRNDSGSTTSSSWQSQTSLDPGPGIHHDRDITHGPESTRGAEAVETRKSAVRSPTIYPELDRYREFRKPEQPVSRHGVDVPFRLATHDLPPSTPGSLALSGSSSQISAISGSPSTKFSDSPGPGPGPYSRDTTPTSLSSQSPVLVVPSRVMAPVRPRQNSPSFSRAPLTRRRANSASSDVDLDRNEALGLAPVRESTTSSSSGSTVRDGGGSKTRRSPSRPPPPPPPSPPPRKSSQRLGESGDVGQASESSRDANGTAGRHWLSKDHMPSSPSQSLSPSRSGPPPRPSRDGTPDIQSQLFEPVPVIQSNLLLMTRPTERRGSETSAARSLPASTATLPQAKPNSPTLHVPAAVVADSEPPSRPATSRSGVFHSRFLFFGRRKPSHEVVDLEKEEPKKKDRKGPAAGTGHEGYGRVGAVRRRSGAAAIVSRPGSDARSPQDSIASRDSFLADRINPVVIAGGEVVENHNASGAELTRIDSEQSMSSERPSFESKSSYSGSSTSKLASRTVLGPSALSRNPSDGARRRPPGNGDTGSLSVEPTLAFQGSLQRPSSSSDELVQHPSPLVTLVAAPSAPPTSFDAAITPDDSRLMLRQDILYDADDSPPTPRKLKRARSPLKWNFFSRSRSRSAAGQRRERVEAAVVAVEKKPVAFYAMMDAGESDPMDIQEVLRCAKIPPAPGPADMPEPRPSDTKPATQEPAPAAARVLHDDVVGAETQTMDRQPPLPAPGVTATPGRPDRLAQVGRIPQVAKRAGSISPQSFSRPLAAVQPLTRSTASVRGPGPVARGLVMPLRLSIPERDLAGDALVGEARQARSAAAAESRALPMWLSPGAGREGSEFLAFTPRKGPGMSTATSLRRSSGSGRLGSFADATAVIPKPEDPPAEDEIWDEYDDLLGEDKAPRSATSSRGIPFHLETYQLGLSEDKPPELPVGAPDSRKTSMHSRAPTHSTSYSADMTERIRKAFKPHESPTAGPRMPAAGQEATSSAAADAAAAGRGSSCSGKTFLSDCSASSSEDGSPLAQVNLRVGSMTVSKWLTFGHVLFSDIRHELASVKSSSKRRSILVIDGLGNDDWSFYAAETYPSASFYNLSPRAPMQAEGGAAPTGFPLSPPNHHQVQHMSPGDRFPFAPQSIHCVVYRFPAAGPEWQYRSVISEARRVLRPSGYMELAILDVDLNNMGNCGRRTVRRLKERIHDQAAGISLASTADLMVRLLGQAGFTQIKAARVGVPVASSITQRAAGKRMKTKEAPSLADMMRDDSPVADESITNVVTRVGRWWYTRCYEKAAGPATGKGIWSDRALLSECEALGTSLKLMVCCARAPDRIASG